MKRITIATFAQCMSIVKQSEAMGDEGYDYYELHETTEEELKVAKQAVNSIGRSILYFSNKSQFHFENNNLYTLTLYRDNETRKNKRNLNRAMSVLA